MMNSFFRISVPLDQHRLEADLAICLSRAWTQHFNTRDYDGDWNVISLRSTSGAESDIISHPEVPFRDTPLMEACAYFKEVAAALQCEKESIRLLRLAPGSKIHTHRDAGTGYAHGNFRLHIPLRSGPGVSFVVDGHEVPMKQGECWYADFDLPHSVANNSENERIHLVIDCVRNEWSDALFAEAGYDFSQEKKGPDKETVLRMIAEFERMDTDVARKLIADLKQQLDA